MKEKWEKPDFSVLSLRNTMQPNVKDNTSFFEGKRTINGATTKDTAS